MSYRRERRRRAGYRALTRGMVAVAAGDPDEAPCSRRAKCQAAAYCSRRKRHSSAATNLLQKIFTTMLDRPETEFLGLRGLVNQALREGDRTTALRLAGRAVTLSPKTRWASLSLFELEVRDGRWEAARDTLAQAVKHRVIAPAAARHHRGVILYEKSLFALSQGDRRRALALAAQGAGADLPPAAALRARMLLEEKRMRRAARAVEQAWRTTPQPQLAQGLGAIWENDPPRAWRFERLAASNPSARESHIALAEAALAAQLWGEARRHLERALAATPPAGTIRQIRLRPCRCRAGGAGSACLASVPARSKHGTGPSVQLCLMMARLERPSAAISR